MAVQRLREIGIRKVLGASARSIVLLLAGWYMHGWLQDYTYRITMSGWIFAAGGVLSILIALLTVGLRAVRAAGANPVRALKSE